MDEKPVVVTTEFRGVFFGYLESRNGDLIVLNKARNCLYWSSDVKGFVGLAVTGPTSSCRVGPAVARLELFKVTSILDPSDEAVKAWEAQPWG